MQFPHKMPRIKFLHRNHIKIHHMYIKDFVKLFFFLLGEGSLVLTLVAINK